MNVREVWYSASSAATSLGLAPPLISIIITHYNYSSHLRGALKSIFDQTHKNWECVVVDDASSAEHRTTLSQIIEEINDSRIKLLQLDHNGGQVPAFFAGLEKTDGNFVCLLDPDDRYAPTFFQESLDAHCNLDVMCPILSTEQILVTKHGVIGAGLCANLHISMMPRAGKCFEIPRNETPQLFYIPSSVAGWHWTSTSALMFRRAALDYLKPRKSLPFKRCADGYLAQGAHLLGGTLFLKRGLVYRMLHSSNSWIAEQVYASSQNKQRTTAEHWTKVAREEAIEAIKMNGLAPAEDQKTNTKIRSARVRRRLARWKRSLQKRIHSKPA
jgi:glycosyltransferase involved in cell wall biosynthesis